MSRPKCRNDSVLPGHRRTDIGLDGGISLHDSDLSGQVVQRHGVSRKDGDLVPYSQGLLD
jgi:hypothetical protein